MQGHVPVRVRRQAPLVGNSNAPQDDEGVRRSSAQLVRLIEREKITTFSAVPMMAREVLMHPDFANTDTSSLKSMGGGGAAMQPDLVKKVGEHLEDTQPGTGYGMTETCGIISALSSAFFQDRPTYLLLT